jgi:hypothetical protein
MKFLTILSKLPCFMNQEDNLRMEDQFSFSGTDDLSITIDENYLKIGRNNDPLRAREQPVNNYLKTPEEMEADFCFVINSLRVFPKEDDSLDGYGRLTKRTDGYMNIHGLDEILSGPMEENY